MPVAVTPAPRAAGRIDRDRRAEACPSRESERRPATQQVVVVVPAHNEEQLIGATLDSLARQSRPVDRIVVVADNCTDATAAIATARGAEILVTVDNRNCKAGALNQALAQVLPGLNEDDQVLIMDADSALYDDWVEKALQARLRFPEAGAICACFLAPEDDHTVLGLLQRIEYSRYMRTMSRRRAQVEVLTGVASLFPAGLLRRVAAARGALLPGRAGEVYDVHSIAEDMEITLAIKKLGYRPVGPMNVRAVTDVMHTWPDLHRQRIRWQRGTLEALALYGFNRITAQLWLGQFLNYLFTLVPAFGAMLLVLTWYLLGWQYDWRWLALVPIFMAEPLMHAWPAGWKARLLVLSLLPLSLYDQYRCVVQWQSLYRAVTRQARTWN